MPTLSVVNFNIVCAVLGGFITLFGLVSYLLKERFYVSEALISSIAGVILSPHAANLIRPLDYALGDQIALDTITLYFARLVLGVQLVLAGVQLPSKYLWTEWRSLAYLLGPGMCGMWISASLLIWALVPEIPFLFALAVGACVCPTDPVLSNTIVKGKFADKNIPRELQKIIIAESGANDGLGYPFLFLPLYLIKYTHDGGAGTTGGAGKAMELWFVESWAYTIILSIVYGIFVGYLAQRVLHWAEERKYIDRESFLVFAISLALFIIGTVGMIGSDDVLACFLAGLSFSWDGWFTKETQDDSLQPTIDMLLNVAIFLWLGAVCPWRSFAHNTVIPLYRLVPLGILILMLRRLPTIFLLHKRVHQIEGKRQALFVGFFGPIGISAIFYLYISLEFLRKVTVNGVQREDAAKLAELTSVVVWFLIICSIVVHGISIPLGVLGINLPRTISAAISSERFPISFSSAEVETSNNSQTEVQSSGEHSALTSRPQPYASGSSLLPRTLQRFAKAVSRDQPSTRPGKIISGPMNPRPIGGHTIKEFGANKSGVGTLDRSHSVVSLNGSSVEGPHTSDQGVTRHMMIPAKSDGQTDSPISLSTDRTIRFDDQTTGVKQSAT